MAGDSTLYTPRIPLIGVRGPLFTSLADRLLTEDSYFLTTEDGHFINLEGDGQ